MFGDEARSDSVRPLRPPVSKSKAEKPVFFEPDRPDTDETDPVPPRNPAALPELVFDPTATGAFPFDLADPPGPADVDLAQDSNETSEEPIVDLSRPEASLNLPFGKVRRADDDFMVSPSSDGWLQRSLFPTESRQGDPVYKTVPPPTVSRSLLDKLRYGNIENLENVRWFHRPIVWLVFGLLAVFVFLLALLILNDASGNAALGLG